jgi:hypothetical protein
MMRIVLALLLTLIALPSLAQTAPTFSPTWSWTAPTTCSDGTPITHCPLTGYTLYTGLKGSTLTAWGTVAAAATSIQTPGTPAGTWCGQLTANDTAGASSAPTAPVCIALGSLIPASPTGTAVTLATTSTIAYVLVPGADTYGVLIVGTVPLATACDVTHVVLLGTVPYYVVPRASVTLTAPFKNIPALLAQCG